ncbi:helix-turn-helix transcriptional regulator [Bacillus smithii]|nr:helix-turn-helix transcriptional regulator [Bacillus smithii]MED4928402.1 helix-turn-helix transcriptional regulator [Bacillus smithii]
MASLGERIKELRVSKELTQSDIAELLNITTRQMMYKILCQAFS